MKILGLYPPNKYAQNIARDLIYGCWCKGKRIAGQKFPPLTLLYILTVLKGEGHDVNLLDAQSEKIDHEETKKRINKIQPEIIIFPTSTMTIKEDCQVVKEYKKDTNATILSFGSHIEINPKQCLDLGIDYGIIKEPEYIIRDFINHKEREKDVRKINGITFLKEKRVIINPQYPFIKNLDELPIPNRSYIKNFEYFSPLVKRLPWTTSITSRGCPGKCNFCTSPIFYGDILRFRSSENVVKEIEYLLEFGYKEIFYRDETFTAHQERLNKICKQIIEKKIDISWICNARIGTLYKENLELMKRAGCHTIKIGVESGVQEILNNIKKGIKIEDTIKTFEIMNKIGINSHVHIMLGCPGETNKSVKQTINFVKKINPTTATFNAFTAFPGTSIFEIVKEKYPYIDGTEQNTEKEHTTGFYNDAFCDLNDKEIETFIKEAYKEFYLRPNYIIKRLLSVRSLSDFRRLTTAGLDVFSFSTGADI